MYKAHQGNFSMVLQERSGGAKKRPLSPDSESSSKPPKLSWYTNQCWEDNRSPRDRTKKLRSCTTIKGGTKVFSNEQIRTWAHLIQMGKHSSYIFPPDKPFWRNRRQISSGESSTTSATPDRSKLQLSPYHLARELALEAGVWSNSSDYTNSWRKGGLARLNMMKCKNH